MPDQEQKPLDYDGASALLLDQVFAPVFFQKLAQDYGIAPANEQEAVKYLQLADKLRYMDEIETAKSAQSRSSLLDQAHSKIDHALGLQPQSQDPAIKQAATYFAQSPVLRDAALLYQDAISQMQSA